MRFASQRHRITRKMATDVVSTRAELINAVGKPDATVWVPGDVTIDMTGITGAIIGPNVTIASNRLLDGRGGMIKTDGYDNGIFINVDAGCRITGLRLKGPRMDNFDPWDWGADEHDYSALGFKLRGKTAIVDHCEVYGWTFAAFVPGTRSEGPLGWFHHNAMHHNQMEHLGYPMDLYNGLHLIEWNYFDYNRHSIAGFGHPENGYEARFNVVGPHAILHSFDMHYLGGNIDSLGRSEKGMVAGKFTNIHHNVFELTDYAAFSIDGYPVLYGRFCNNWCAEAKGPGSIGGPGKVIHYPDDADMRVKNNQYGPEAVKPGREWLKKTAQQFQKNSDGQTGAIEPPRPEPSPMSSNELPVPKDKQSEDVAAPPEPQARTIDPLTGAPLTPPPGGH